MGDLKNTKAKARPLKIQFAPADQGGTSFHWLHLPAKILNDSGLAEAIVDRQFRMDQDILIVQRQINPDVIGGIQHMQANGIPVLYWIEDQVWLLPFTSPVRREYTPKAQANMLKIIAACDGALCSSEPLARFLRNTNKNTTVLPHIMLKKWSKIYKPKTKRVDNDIRILWTTTAHHAHDFNVIEHAMKDVATRYPNVKIIMWGYITRRLSEMVPPKQLEYYGWIPVDYYYKCLASMEADIGIAPLDATDTYNKAKTPLKFLEYGLMEICPVVSDVLPYQCVEHMKTGYVVPKNKHRYWTTALYELIENAELRKSLAKNAHKWVLENHTDSRIEEYMGIYNAEIKKAKEKAKEHTKTDHVTAR